MYCVLFFQQDIVSAKYVPTQLNLMWDFRYNTGKLLLNSYNKHSRFRNGNLHKRTKKAKDAFITDVTALCIFILKSLEGKLQCHIKKSYAV